MKAFNQVRLGGCRIQQHTEVKAMLKDEAINRYKRDWIKTVVNFYICDPINMKGAVFLAL